MATKKRCAQPGCDKTGKSVKAAQNNTSGSQVGARRCRCKAHR
ncbi:MAG: hypothetical protein JWO85_244 [Candidatus Eremiobacteraeota bacterium]|nr:hypothetical protein [Candidatus Eremiobacteraeota bacterium]